MRRLATVERVPQAIRWLENNPRGSRTRGERGIAEILEAERKRQGIEPLESPERVVRIKAALFHGIGLLGVLQPEVAEEAHSETAIPLVARGLGGST